jgi:hypothetical protein
MTGDRGRHAQPRIGVDVRSADEAFGEFIGDIIILGQQLARQIKRDCLWTVCCLHPRKFGGGVIKGLIPGNFSAVDERVEQSVGRTECFTKSRTF